MDTSRSHPFHQAISEVERALAQGACSRAINERVGRLEAWLDEEVSTGWLSEPLYSLLSRQVEELRRVADRRELELTLSALANLDEAATLLHALTHEGAHA